MNFIEDINRIKKQNLLKKEGEFSFPEFMRLLRRTSGLRREDVAALLGCSITKLYYAETGKYEYGPQAGFISELALFYDVPAELLKRKLSEFMEDKCKKP